jgi:hypothetical protein
VTRSQAGIVICACGHAARQKDTDQGIYQSRKTAHGYTLPQLMKAALAFAASRTLDNDTKENDTNGFQRGT